jgi:hypothetical protein
MKITWIAVFLGITNFVSAQNDMIKFTYDGAGNQVQRILCINCLSAKNANDSIKEVSVMQEEDLQKFTPNDNISYYPNPVKQELYLQWDLIDGTQISSISIYDLNGRLLQSLNDVSKVSNKNISFQNYPRGVYAVVLNYNNAEQKSIKIIKE